MVDQELYRLFGLDTVYGPNFTRAVRRAPADNSFWTRVVVLGVFGLFVLGVLRRA
jgi:hypothetical protein